MRIATVLLLLSAGGRCLADLPTTRPAQTTITLDNATNSELLETDDWELDMQNQLSFDSGAILFGEMATYNDDDKATATVPVIGCRQNDHILAMKVEDRRLKNAAWSYISAGPSKDEFWGVLDASLDTRQPELVLVHSTDAGKTIHLASLVKPAAVCVFDSFCMDHKGHGRVSVYMDRTKAPRHQAGYYHFRTEDDGQTWSGPQFEADAMTPAEDAPEDANKPAAKPSRV